MNKKIELSILFFRLTIYSEDRYIIKEHQGKLYKHFLNFKLFNIDLLSVKWFTGRNVNDAIDDNVFQVSGILNKVINYE